MQNATSPSGTMIAEAGNARRRGCMGSYNQQPRERPIVARQRDSTKQQTMAAFMHLSQHSTYFSLPQHFMSEQNFRFHYLPKH